MKRLKVLMVGWEFPPVINGGLGVACLGLSKALASFVDLSIILPKTDPNFLVKNVNLIGLNNLDLATLSESISQSSYSNFSKSVSNAEVALNPYPGSSQSGSSILEQKNKLNSNTISSSTSNPFQVDDLYGNDILLRINQFADYAAEVASTMDFDVIHCHDWMTFPAGIRIKEQSKKPLVAHIHSLEYDRAGPESKSWVFDIEKEAMCIADLVIPVSNYTGSIAQDHYQISPSKIFSVHNGVDLVEVYKERKEFPEKLVLFLGRITGQKGPQFFLDIASKVLQHSPNVRFVMAGTGDQLRDLIEDGAYKNIGTKFHFTGFLTKEKVHKVLSMTDIYCMPSVSEPFGLSALEAAQFGIPCVISKQSGVSEVLFGALKADFWDIEKMASHIITLLQNNSLKDALVKDAFNDLKSCTWEKAAEKVNSLYNKVSPSV